MFKLKTIVSVGIGTMICWNSIVAGNVVKQDNNFKILHQKLPSATVSKPQGSGKVILDIHANYWTLVGNGTEKELYVLPAQDQSKWIKDELSGIKGGDWKFIASDEFGYLFVADSKRIVTINPSTPENGLFEVPALPQGTITDMAAGLDGEVFAVQAEGRLLKITRKVSKAGKLKGEADIVTAFDCPKNVSKLAVDIYGTVWLTAADGIYSLQSELHEHHKNWPTISRMPGGTHDLGACVIGEKCYVGWAVSGTFGYPSTGIVSSKLMVFDAKTKLWSIAADYGIQRGYAGIGELDGKVWTIGGDIIDEHGERVSTKRCQIFDPATGTMAEGPEIPECLPSTLALNSNGRLYVLGYRTGGIKGAADTMQLFSIGTGESSWTREPEGPLAGGSSYGTELNGKLYSIVGHKFLAIYDTKTKKWSTSAPPHLSRASHVGAYKGEVWVIGGRGKNCGDACYIYNPIDGTWRKGPQPPRTLAWGCAFNINGELYMTGGQTGPGYCNRTFKLMTNN